MRDKPIENVLNESAVAAGLHCLGECHPVEHHRDARHGAGEFLVDEGASDLFEAQPAQRVHWTELGIGEQIDDYHRHLRFTYGVPKQIAHQPGQ